VLPEILITELLTRCIRIQGSRKMGAEVASDDFVIPTIDIGPYTSDPTSKAAEEIVEDVKKACMTTGFFSLVGHNISQDLQRKVFKAAERLFALPLEEKKKLIPAGRRPLARGYEIIGAQALQDGLPDLKEVCSAHAIGAVVEKDQSLTSTGLLHWPAHRLCRPSRSAAPRVYG
jgi:isopenicillin N synthase-like dioxygenase